MNQQVLVSTKIAAALLGLKPNTLAIWRAGGLGPAFVRVGSRAIRYSLDDLDAYIAATVPHLTLKQALKEIRGVR